MFLDEATPDTSVYMIAGYAIFFLITAIYLVSLFLRTRNLRRDLESLEGMEQEPEAAPFRPAAVAPAKPRPSRSTSSKAARSKPARKRAAKKK